MRNSNRRSAFDFKRGVLFLLAAFAAQGASSKEAVPSSPLRERYFNSDWASVKPEAVAPIAPLETPQALKEERPGTTHAQVAHMYITRKAYELYSSRYAGGELARYIGDYQGELPDGDTDDNVVEGSYDEDVFGENPWGQILSYSRHFWNWRGGPYRGLAGFDSAVNRAHKYFTGGYGLDDVYDEKWSGNGGHVSKRGVKGRGIFALYRRGEKGKTYCYLGHAAHLVEDLTIPAHAHLWAHLVPNMDRYETYMHDHHSRFQGLPEGPLESFDSVYALFKKTAQITERYDAGYGPRIGGVDGTIDKGARRNDYFTDEALDAEGAVLIPLAIQRVAELFLYFYRQADREAPQVTLDASESAAAGLVALAASADDEISGVDRMGYRFEYRSWDGREWSAWIPVESSGAPSARLAALGGTRYALRASARDAAGNVGVSAVRYLSVESSPSLASLF